MLNWTDYQLLSHQHRYMKSYAHFVQGVFVHKLLLASVNVTQQVSHQWQPDKALHLRKVAHNPYCFTHGESSVHFCKMRIKSFQCKCNNSVPQVIMIQLQPNIQEALWTLPACPGKI